MKSTIQSKTATAVIDSYDQWHQYAQNHGLFDKKKIEYNIDKIL